jgi:hypothetical protein
MMHWTLYLFCLIWAIHSLEVCDKPALVADIEQVLNEKKPFILP